MSGAYLVFLRTTDCTWARACFCVCVCWETRRWMANASPCMPSGAMAQVFFPPVASSPPGSAVMQQGTLIPMASLAEHGGFSVMDLTPVQASGGAAVPSLTPVPSGVSFIIQIGLSRESVLMPQNADLAYVKQIACSIVDTKVRKCACVCVLRKAACQVKLGVCLLLVESCLKSALQVTGLTLLSVYLSVFHKKPFVYTRPFSRLGQEGLNMQAGTEQTQSKCTKCHTFAPV